MLLTYNRAMIRFSNCGDFPECVFCHERILQKAVWTSFEKWEKYNQFYHVRIHKGGQGVRTPHPEKSQKYRISYQYWFESLENHKATKPSFNFGPSSASAKRFIRFRLAPSTNQTDQKYIQITINISDTFTR